MNPCGLEKENLTFHCFGVIIFRLSILILSGRVAGPFAHPPESGPSG